MSYRVVFPIAFLFSSLNTANAQSSSPQATQKVPPIGSSSSTIRVELPTPVAETPVPLVGAERGSLQTLSFVTPDANFERAFVKDAAFSAESVTEHVQTLSDGNRLTRKSTAHIYRDAAGRTRREHELSRRGMSPNGEAGQLIVINDPIGRVNYVIETQTGVARKMELPPPRVREAMERARGDNAPFSVLMPASAAHRRMREGDGAQKPAEPVKEKLPAQVIEGVLTEGTRTSVTIPVGEFDNDQPLVISHEEWYAPELHMIVLMKHNDPRFGETTFRLTNINRSEPAAELFKLSPDYRVVDDRQQRMIGPGRPPVLRP
jgi:hypothetical protein